MSQPQHDEAQLYKILVIGDYAVGTVDPLTSFGCR